MWNGEEDNYPSTSTGFEENGQESTQEPGNTPSIEEEKCNTDELKGLLFQDAETSAQGVREEDKDEQRCPDSSTEQQRDVTSSIFKGMSFNGMRLWYLSTYPCQKIMCEILKHKNPYGKTDKNLRELIRRRQTQSKTSSKYINDDFKGDISYRHLDITGMYTIARNFLNEEILAGSTYWNTMPSESDFSLQACVDKLRQFRNFNAHLGHSNTPDEENFKQRCKEMKTVFEAVEKTLGIRPKYGLIVDRTMLARKPTAVAKLERQLSEPDAESADYQDRNQQVLDSLDDTLKKIVSEFQNFNENLGGQEAQTKRLIENHEVEDRFYVETKLSKRAENLLKKHHHILITGDKGSGKTALAYHLMFQLLKMGNCKVHNIHSISDFLNNIDPDGFCVVLVEISEIRSQKDPSSLKTIIKEYIRPRQSESLYIIMTSGLENVTQIASLTYHVDMTEPEDDTLCLNCHEKYLIVQNQLERAKCNNPLLIPPNEETVREIASGSENPIAFPLAAFLYAENESYRKFGSKFFTSPVVYYRTEIERCTDRNSNTIILLTLLFEKTPTSFYTDQHQKIKSHFSEDDLCRRFCKAKRMKELPDAAAYLTTEQLLCEEEKKYSFKNDTVKKAMLGFAVEKFPTLCIRNFDQETLCKVNIVRGTVHEQNSILLEETHKRILASRFFEDLINDSTSVLYRSDAWLDQDFKVQFIEAFKKHIHQTGGEDESSCVNKLLEWSTRYRCLPLCEAIETFLHNFDEARRIGIMTKYLLRTCETMNSSEIPEHAVKTKNLLQFFVKEGADCSHCTCFDNTGADDHSYPLQWIIKSNNDECLRILLKAGANDPHSTWGFWNLLAAAAREEETTICRCSFVKMQCPGLVSEDHHNMDSNLADFGRRVQTLKDDSQVNQKDFVCFCMSTIGLNARLLRAMKIQNFQINNKDEMGNNYLHLLLSSSPLPATLLETVSVLLLNFPSLVEDKNNALKTPMAIAVQSECDIKCIAKLSEKCTEGTLNEALQLCVESNLDDDIVSQRVSEMVRYGAKPHALNSACQNAIHSAISRGKNRIKTLGILAQCRNDADIPATIYMLHYCIKLDLGNTDKEEVVNVLIKEGADVNQQDAEGVTPIMLAIQETKDNVSLVNLLLVNGAKINVLDKEGMHPLHYCCMADIEAHVVLEVVELLLKADDEILKKETPATYTPAMLAIINKKQPELVEKLLDTSFDIHKTDTDGNTMLHLLMHSPFADEFVQAIAFKCLQKSANPFVQNQRKETPLMSAFAAGQHRFMTVRYILHEIRSAYQSSKDLNGRTLLHACVVSSMSDENTSDLCQLLIECGESVTDEDFHTARNTPLHLAIASSIPRLKTICTLLKESCMAVTLDLFEVIKESNKMTNDLLISLFDNKIVLDDECKANMTPFHLNGEFSTNVEANIVLPLTKLGFDVNSRTNCGDTILVSGCRSNCSAALLRELAKYSDHRLCKRKSESYLPLIVQSKRSDEDTKSCIESIITEANQPIDQSNQMHRTALTESVRERKPMTLKYLVSRGANPGIRDRRGKTALHYCVESEMFDDEVCDMLSVLLEAKPNVEIVDKRERTVLNLASCQETKSRILTFIMLLKHQYTVDTVDQFGRTPLHNCMKYVNGYNKTQTLERLCRLTVLMLNKAEPYCMDDNDKTVIDICNESPSNPYTIELNILNQENMDDLPGILQKLFPSDDSVVGETCSENDNEQQLDLQLNSNLTKMLQNASRYLMRKSLNDPDEIVIGFTMKEKENIAFPLGVHVLK